MYNGNFINKGIISKRGVHSKEHNASNHIAPLFKFIFLASMIIFMPIQAIDIQETLKNIINHYKIGLASWSSLFTNDLQFLMLGSEDLSLEMQKKIDKILVELGLEDKVRVKQMSEFLIESIGFHNALATVNTIFINEESFNLLSHEEQRFLIGHEAGHIKHRDIIRHFAFAALVFAVANTVHNGTKRFSNKFIQGMAFRTSMITAYLAVLANKRRAEREADLYSIEQLQCHNGAIAWNSRFCDRGIDQQHDDSYFARINAYFAKLLSTHPDHQERISYAVSSRTYFLCSVREKLYCKPTVMNIFLFLKDFFEHFESTQDSTIFCCNSNGFA